MEVGQLQDWGLPSSAGEGLALYPGPFEHILALFHKSSTLAAVTALLYLWQVRA